MRRFGQWTKVGMAAFGVALLSSSVVAEDKIVLVKERQAFMKALGEDNKVISDFGRGKASKDAAAKAIADMEARTAKMSSLFVAGTSSADLPGVSYAKPKIWAERPKFDAIISSLKEAEVAEAANIKAGPTGAISGGLLVMGRNGCGACHVSFREKLPS
jgi:cytochrome c556